MRTFESVDELAAETGASLGPTEWATISQHEINLFAEATGDHQWIHVDAERAADGPFGKTIAHGFLTLSLLPRFFGELYQVEGVKMGINYGLNKVRFPSPVPVDARVRASGTIVSVEDLGKGAHQLTMSVTVEIDGVDKPACVAESVVRLLT